jgi:hypothetical protein
MSPRRQTALVLLAAMLGIVLAAAVTWGTSQLVRQRIGLASEPLTAGRRLLPPTTHRSSAAGKSRPRGKATTSTRLPTPTPSSAPSPTTQVGSSREAPPTAAGGTGADRSDSAPGASRDD